MIRLFHILSRLLRSKPGKPFGPDDPIKNFRIGL